MDNDPTPRRSTLENVHYRCYKLKHTTIAAARHQYCRLSQGASLLLQRSRLRQACGLVILDDSFPNLLTGFRIAEFNQYLDTFPDCQIFTSDSCYDIHQPEYASYFPQFARRVLPWNRYASLPGRLAYCIFLNNAIDFLPTIERHGLPFIFTLYPGGGFRLDDAESDRKLRRVCSSRFFRGVIVTQTVTRDYLLQKEFCDPARVEFVFGGVFASDLFGTKLLRKQYLGRDKETLDIAFVAHKYMPRGVDKGYDVFLEVASILSTEIPSARFHVIGGFGPEEIDVTHLGNKIQFYGSLFREELARVYSGMDLILAPNVPFRLYEGAFDGFPTGCCIEAGLRGVAVFATDPLDCNIAFANGEEIVIIPRDPRAIADRVCHYYGAPDQLYHLAARGQRAFARIFAIDRQMAPRLSMLDRHLPGPPAKPILFRNRSANILGDNLPPIS